MSASMVWCQEDKETFRAVTDLARKFYDATAARCCTTDEQAIYDVGHALDGMAKGIAVSDMVDVTVCFETALARVIKQNGKNPRLYHPNFTDPDSSPGALTDAILARELTGDELEHASRTFPVSNVRPENTFYGNVEFLFPLSFWLGVCLAGLGGWGVVAGANRSKMVADAMRAAIRAGRPLAIGGRPVTIGFSAWRYNLAVATVIVGLGLVAASGIDMIHSFSTVVIDNRNRS